MNTTKTILITSLIGIGFILILIYNGCKIVPQIDLNDKGITENRINPLTGLKFKCDNNVDKDIQKQKKDYK